MEEEKIITSEALKENPSEEENPTIELKVGVEVVGENEPSKYDRKRGFWRRLVWPSLIAVCVSAVGCTYLPRVGVPYSYCAVAFCASVAAFILSICKALELHPGEATGTMPWWYGGL